MSRLLHGEAKPPTPEYRVWLGMWTRCTNRRRSRFKDYGGRGIDVCARWRAYENFLRDMGRRPSPRHSLDRKKGDDGYTPSNCRWASPSEQVRNRRNVQLYTVNGESLILTDWADRLGVRVQVIYDRIYKLNWTTERAVTTPVDRRSLAERNRARARAARMVFPDEGDEELDEGEE